MAGVKIIRPQVGYQMKALSSTADIVIGGGSAGAGKTYSLLLEPLRHKDVKGFGSVTFRRTSPQIRSEGGLWDTSKEIYPYVNARSRESVLEWEFTSGVKLKFSHLEHEKNILDWQGSQIPLLMFDELTHFTEKMFFYLLSRNRSACGVKPYVRATCNPDPDSWVAKLIEWWIDQNTGYPIPERDGVVRYFIKKGNDYIWGNTVAEVVGLASFFLDDEVKKSGVKAEDFVKSITFISGNVYDNKELLNVNPQYLANLISQDEQTQSQLLKGNWKIVVSDNDIYDYHAFANMFDASYTAKNGKKYITADIALKGSDKFIVGVWDGLELIDIVIMDKSDGKQVIDSIVEMSKKHRVPNSNIVYDNDGVGGFIDGFIRGARPFVNNGKAMNGENYDNLKTQCYYKSGDKVNGNEYVVSEHVAAMMYDDSMTVRQRMMYERKAIKRDKADMDGKLRIIKKDEMKVRLNSQSPDMMDMFMMREYFEITQDNIWGYAV